MLEVYSFRENHGAVKKQGLLRVPTTKWVPRPAMTTPDLTILYVGSMRDSKHVEEA
jgi:sugar lactone lactonase YvrE